MCSLTNSYNIKTARCDGNDTWAVHHVMKQAREIAVRDKVPVLIEAMTYRGGCACFGASETRC